MHAHTHTVHTRGTCVYTNVVGLRVHDHGGGTHLRGLHNNINIVCAAATIRFVQALDGGGDADGRRTWDVVVVVAERDSRRSGGGALTVGIFFNIDFLRTHLPKLAPAINASLFIFIVCVCVFFVSIRTNSFSLSIIYNLYL